MQETSCLGDCSFAARRRGRLVFHREMLAQPVVNGFTLACIYNALPTNISGFIIVFGHDVLRCTHDSDGPFRAVAAGVEGVVNDLAIFHVYPIVTGFSGFLEG